MRTRLALAAGLVAVAVVVALNLAPSEPRRSGTNNVPVAGPVAELPPGAETCQSEDVPKESSSLRLRVEAPRGAALPAVEIAQPAGPPVAGRATDVPANGSVDVRLPTPPEPGLTDVCVRNAGKRPLLVLGYPTGDRNGRRNGPIAIEYYRGGEESWLQIASTVAHRMALDKSGVLGDWTLWLVMALVLGALGLAAAALWRIGAAE